MNYELAKQLKDNGFPLPTSGYSVSDKDGENTLQIPTLSELIDACGINIYTLEHNNLTTDNECWYANSGSYPGGSHRGKTPEEAVAKLWLKLNKK